MKKKIKGYRNHRAYLKKWLRVGAYAGGSCEVCGEKLILMFRYDAVCCPGCNQWIDPCCSDPECPFCQKRPETPWEVLETAPGQLDLSERENPKEYCTRQYEKNIKGKHRKEEILQKSEEWRREKI